MHAIGVTKVAGGMKEKIFEELLMAETVPNLIKNIKSLIQELETQYMSSTRDMKQFCLDTS
jgi:hypothetical protein